MTQSEDTPNQEIAEVGTPEITRTNLGQFVAGVSGNPKGRPKGSKNRTVLIKQAMEEALTRDVAGALEEIVDKVIELAKGGDKDMIKLILGDILKEVRKSDDVADVGDSGAITVNLTQFFGETSPGEKAIEAEFEEVTQEK